MFEAFILGVIQGLTEFLPVSSSGHLLLFQQWLTIPGDPLLFDLAVHLATLLPVLWVYREDLLGILKAPLRERGALAELHERIEHRSGADGELHAADRSGAVALPAG